MTQRGTKPASVLMHDCVFVCFAILTWACYYVYSVVPRSETPSRSSIKHDSVVGLNAKASSFNPHLERQSTAVVQDNVTLVDLPDQPDRMVLLLLSVVAANSKISQSISDGIITCLSNVSNTEIENWGAFRLDRFTPALVQLEYFVLTTEEGSLVVPEQLDKFIRDGMLTECVRVLDVGLPTSGRLLQGRTVIATETGSIVSARGNVPGWVVGVVIGCIVGVGLIALVILWSKGETIYKEEDYEKYEDDESQEEGDLSESEDEELRSANMANTIPGQPRQGIAFHM